MGSVDLRSDPLEITLDTTPIWVVGVAATDGVVWVTVDMSGSVTAFLVRDDTVEAFNIDVDRLPAGMPPTVAAGREGIRIVDPSTARPDASSQSGTMMVNHDQIVITQNGALMIGATAVPGVEALIDSRVVLSEIGTAAIMTDPTDRFRHGVLGDAIEAETVTLIDPVSRAVVATLEAPGETVFEAIAPLWADIDGDGEQDVLVTASDSVTGARLVAFRTDGSILAESEPIGRGNRWLNQLGVAPVGPTGEIEIVEVRTPHIGGIVGWYQYMDGALVKQASAPGYSTHGIGSRNLDEGVIVDANADGQLDVVVPTQDDSRLVALTRTVDGAEAAVTVSLPSAPASNVVAVLRPDGSASLAVALEGGVLLVWR